MSEIRPCRFDTLSADQQNREMVWLCRRLRESPVGLPCDLCHSARAHRIVPGSPIKVYCTRCMNLVNLEAQLRREREWSRARKRR
jgi:hypothetical protein